MGFFLIRKNRISTIFDFTMNALQNRMISIATILLAAAVALGAFGAHILGEKISEADMAIFKTANFYHFIHALGILILAAFTKKLHSLPLVWSSFSMFLGILLFSGSLYFLALSEWILGERVNVLGLVTPAGGVAFIVGWLIPAFAVRKKLSNTNKVE